MSNETTLGPYFTLFTEIGIIEQLGRALLEAQLPEGIIAPHFAVLNHLVRVQDGQTPRKLAAAFQVPKTTMTHTLAGLEKHKLVEMRPNPKDARSKCVWLTASGRELRDRAIRGMGPELARVAGVVPATDLEAVLPVLQRLRTHLDAARNKNDLAT